MSTLSPTQNCVNVTLWIVCYLDSEGKVVRVHPNAMTEAMAKSFAETTNRLTRRRLPHLHVSVRRFQLDLSDLVN